MVKLISRLGLLLGALGLPVAALAAGLGKLTVHSALGDPLQAEIEIVSVRSDELASLQARIAPPSAYKQANIDYQPGLASVRAKIETRAGRPVVVLTSTQPITDPFLNVLVELTWTTGAVTREYTFLLDPPAYAAPKPAVPEVKEARPQEAPPQPAPPSRAAPAPSPGPAPVVAAAPAEPTPGTYGPVRRGETLSQIAERTRHPGASLEQMLVALFRSNPDAFMDNNMNRLKAGPILRVPNREETMAIGQKEAVAEFRAQVASWKAYRDQLAAAAATVESPAGEGQAAAGQVTAAVEEKGQAEPPKEVLKLSKAEAELAPAGQSLQERIRALEEENVAKEKALKEAQERVALLEKNIQDMQKLLELKGQPLVPTASEAGKTDAPQAKPESAAQAGAAPQPQVKPETAPTAPAPQLPAQEAPAPEQPRQQAAPKPAPPPPAEPSLMETLLGEPLYLAGAGGVVVLLLGWGLYASRRRQAARAAPEEVFAEPGIDSAPAAAAASQEATAPLSAESTAAGPGTLDEVDPLQEAEVYLTYRRDAQAEEVLKEALAKTPKRPELYLKLLEVYSMRQDKAQFEETARRLQAIAPGTPHWEKAVAMGLALDPTNPLYGGTPAPAASGAGLGTVALATERSLGMDVDFDLGGKPQAETPPQRPAPSAEGERAGVDTSTVDFEITSGVTAGHQREMKAARDVDESLSVSFDLSGLEQSRTGDRPAGPQESTATKLDFDFSLDLGEPAQETPGGVKDAHWQEVATKFDLAKAYKEMGDKEGAREILQEVLREGDEQQRRDAQALLETL